MKRHSILTVFAVALACLAPAGSQAQCGPPAAASSKEEVSHLEETNLASCEVLEGSVLLRDSSRELADHLASSYTGSHPAAVTLANSMAEISAVLDAELRDVAPRRGAFAAAWAAFDSSVRRSPLPRDRALRPVLGSYKQVAREVLGHLGCEPESDAVAMIPCETIPLAHHLAVAGEEMHQYVAAKYGENYPEQTQAAGDLARAARSLHEVLHDLEIAVPGAQRTHQALVHAFSGSSLTDTDEPQDVEVKSRVRSVGEAVERLGRFVGACHAPAAAHEHQ